MAVRIEEIQTTLEMMEPAGPLSAEDIERIAERVMERLQEKQDRHGLLAEDRVIRNRTYVPDWRKQTT